MIKFKIRKRKIPSYIFSFMIYISICYFLFSFFILGIGIIENYYPPSSFRINIQNDEDFQKYNFLGSGTKKDPYIIENYTIIMSGSPIRISSVSKHFIIRNNYLKGGNAESAIYLHNIKINSTKIYNNTIIGNIYRGNRLGIELSQCENILIKNNKILNFREGLTVGNNCRNISVSKNLFKSIYRNINILMSESINVLNNTFYYLNYIEPGKMLGTPISFWESKYIKIDYNKFYNKSFTSIYTNSALVSFKNNTINDLKIGIFEDKNNLEIEDKFGQIILLNCNSSIIKNQVIKYTTCGIYLYNSQNCILSSISSKFNLDEGIIISKCNNLSVYDCQFSNNWKGIALYGSNNCSIQNSTISNNYYGLYTSSSNYYLSNITFSDNTYDEFILT